MPHRLSHGVLTWTFDPGREVHLSISDHVPLPLPGYLYLDGFEGGLDERLTCCQLSWLALLTLAISWWEMEFGRLAWHMDVAHMISRTIRYLLKISLNQWTRAIDLIGLRVVALGSSEILSSDLVGASHLSVKSQSRSLGLTSGRCPHDIADSYFLWTMEWIDILSFACRHLSLPSVFDVWQMVQVIPTPERWNPNPHGMVCVVELLCGGCSGWAHVTRFLQCPESPVTSAFGLGLESWVCSCLPAYLVHHL